MANPGVKALQIVFVQPNAPYPFPQIKAIGIVIPPPQYPKLKGLEIVTTQAPITTNYPKLKGLNIYSIPVTTTMKQGTFKQVTITGA